MNMTRLSHIWLSVLVATTAIGCSASSNTPAFSSNLGWAGVSQVLNGLPSQIGITGSGLTGSVGVPAPVTTDAGVTVSVALSTSPPVGLTAPTPPAGATLVGFLSVGFSQTTTLIAPLSLSSSLTATTMPANAFAYTYSGGAWVPAAFAAATISGAAPFVGTLIPTAVSTTFNAGTIYSYAIFRQ